MIHFVQDGEKSERKCKLCPGLVRSWGSLGGSRWQSGGALLQRLAVVQSRTTLPHPATSLWNLLTPWREIVHVFQGHGSNYTPEGLGQWLTCSWAFINPSRLGLTGEGTRDKLAGTWPQHDTRGWESWLETPFLDNAAFQVRSSCLRLLTLSSDQRQSSQPMLSLSFYSLQSLQSCFWSLRQLGKINSACQLSQHM